MLFCMSLSRQQIRFGKLVRYRSQLLKEGKGRAGLRLPGMKEGLRQWCHHSRSRRDFILLMLEARIRGHSYKTSEVQEMLSVSRNTLVSIIDEANSFDILNAGSAAFLASSRFFDLYSAAYLDEWRLISVEASEALAEAFQELTTERWNGTFDEAWEVTRDLAVLSRAESVKATRSSRLTSQKIEPLDLSSWVVLNTFNRDLLLLVMAAAVESHPVNQSQIITSLNASRNSIKESLNTGIAAGFIIKEPRGYMASQEALNLYLQWHIDTFASYEAQHLSAMSGFYRQLHADRRPAPARRDKEK